jgi:hypothetical protein
MATYGIGLHKLDAAVVSKLYNQFLRSSTSSNTLSGDSTRQQIKYLREQTQSEISSNIPSIEQGLATDNTSTA